MSASVHEAFQLHDQRAGAQDCARVSTKHPRVARWESSWQLGSWAAAVVWLWLWLLSALLEHPEQLYVARAVLSPSTVALQVVRECRRSIAAPGYAILLRGGRQPSVRHRNAESWCALASAVGVERRLTHRELHRAQLC